MSDHSVGSAVDVVIGAAAGMGEAVARRLDGSGRRLLLADIDLAGAERLAGELGGAAEAHRCDLTDTDDLAALAAAAGAGADRLGALVMTAGLSPTMAPGRRILEVDLVGPAQLLQAFAPIAAEGSAALLFSSMASHLVPANRAIDTVLDTPESPSFVDDLAAAGVDVDEPGAAYAYAKRGLRRLVQREAVTWGRQGARLLSLSPGIVDTAMGRQEDAGQPAMAAMVAASPMRRMLLADEIAAVAEFLVGEGAGAMTGTDVLVDGGVVAALLRSAGG